MIEGPGRVAEGITTGNRVPGGVEAGVGVGAEVRV